MLKILKQILKNFSDQFLGNLNNKKNIQTTYNKDEQSLTMRQLGVIVIVGKKSPVDLASIFLEPPIDLPEPGVISVTNLSGWLALFVVCYWAFKRYRGITLQLDIVLVRNNDNTYCYALIDKSDPYGIKLRLLYYNCIWVKGCYIELNGKTVYALISNRLAPDLAYNVDIVTVFRILDDNTLGDLHYVTWLPFPGPNPEHWDNLCRNMNIKLYYGLERVEPVIDLEDEFSIGLTVRKHNIINEYVFIRWS
jgi:hypothetical protein